MALWEGVAPPRAQPESHAVRWPNHFGIVGLNALLVRVVFPATAVGLALFMEQQGWGLFNSAPLPYWLIMCMSVILLDLFLYLQHVLFHAVPIFWRLH